MRLSWSIALAASLSLLGACSTNPGPTEPGAGETDTDVNLSGDDAADGTDLVPDTELDTRDEEVEDDTDVEDLDTDDDDTLEPGTCNERSDCPLRHACIDNLCVRECSTMLECDDNNPCTLDRCTDELCDNEAIEVSLADEDPGDCLHMTCVEGELVETVYPEDVPEDDGVPCTIETCTGRYPAHIAADYLCDDGDPDNGDEVCSPVSGGCAGGGDPHWICEDFDPGWESTEVCGDGQDNDEDGMADEGCPCDFGSTQRCFTGPPNARDVGGCLDGYQQCIDRSDPHWGECVGVILPGEEVCDAKDNNCNGCIDDIPDCSPLLACPTEDWSQPLRHYQLDASTIFGEEGVSWEWTVLAPPNSATHSVEDPDAERTSVYMDVSGDYFISLTVTDEKDDVYGCSWVVHAEGSGLRVEMRWDTFGSVDMDLHLHESGNREDFCSDADCYFANCRVDDMLDWGYPTSPSSECDTLLASCPNPRLDIDNIRGNDPENINIDLPENGDVFRVMAHMYSGSAETHPIVSIYCGGTLRAVLGEDPDPAIITRASSGCMGDTWRVADVEMIVDPRTGATDCDVHVLTDSRGDWDIRNNDDSF